MPQSLAYYRSQPENLNRVKGAAASVDAGAEPPGMFQGSRLFQLRATHGLPLGDALSRLVGAGVTISWVSFLTEARTNGWYDFQSLDAIEQAWIDADLDPESLQPIVLRLKLWILANPIVGKA